MCLCTDEILELKSNIVQTAATTHGIHNNHNSTEHKWLTDNMYIWSLYADSFSLLINKTCDTQQRDRTCTCCSVYQCLHGMAPAYLTELCTPVAASASRRGGLRSSTTSDLVIPRCRLSTYGTRAFSVAGPVTPVCWNALPDYLKSPELSFHCFRRQVKTFLFCKYWQLALL